MIVNQLLSRIINQVWKIEKYELRNTRRNYMPLDARVFIKFIKMFKTSRDPLYEWTEHSESMFLTFTVKASDEYRASFILQF